MATESYLVTGGCGLQGSAIVEKLLAAYPGAPVAVLARHPNANRFPGVAYHRGDVTSAADVRAAFAAAPRPTVVFHCAGVMTIGRKPQPDEVVRAINEGGTRTLVDEAAAAGTVRALVYTSSASVVQVDTWRDIEMGDESLPTCRYEDKTAVIYPQSKAEGERIVLAADNPAGMRTCSLRPAAIYGERDNDITPAMMRNLRAGNTRMQIGPNTNRVSYTYVGNAADAHLLAADKLLRAPAGVGGEAFFVTNDVVLPFWDFPREVFAAAGQPVPLDKVRVLSRGTMLCVAWALEWYAWLRGTKPLMDRNVVRFTCLSRSFDITKAKERLGYEPKVEWKEGVRRAVEWYIANEKKE